MKTYTYHWLFIPTMASGQRTITDVELRRDNYKSIYEALNKWNTSQDWKYWIHEKDISVYSGNIKEIT